MSREVVGVTSDGVKILRPVAKPTNFTMAQAIAAVRKVLAKEKAMGGPWNIPTGNPLLRVDDWGWRLTVEYAGDEDWPSYSLRKWYWEAE